MLWVLIRSASLLKTYAVGTRWGTSNEYPQHIFSWGNKKNYQYLCVDIFKPILSFFYAFIVHNSRNTQTDSFEFHFL